MSLALPLARNLRGWRFLALALALVLTLAALVAPALPVTRSGAEILIVVDITGSMNVRDYARDGRPVSRLDTAKAALRRLVADLPCGSRVALGLFTERRPFLLFAPIETCADFAPLDGALAALDWRMAWEGDSRIAAGLHRAIAMAAGLGTDLVFVTDGQETPPLPGGEPPAFDGQPGAVRGLIVGAGGYTLSPIPRYDERGRRRGSSARPTWRRRTASARRRAMPRAARATTRATPPSAPPPHGAASICRPSANPTCSASPGRRASPTPISTGRAASTPPSARR